MSLSTDVIDLLDALGDTAAQVADTLIEKGITGNCEDPSGCPIFNYLTYEGLAVQSVGDEEIEVDGTSVAPPPQITAFIHAFDQHEWPELIAEGCSFWRSDEVES